MSRAPYSKRYVLCPGRVTSKDGDRHTISAPQLAELYGLDFRRCWTLRPEQDYLPGTNPYRRDDSVEYLYPQYSIEAYENSRKVISEREAAHQKAWMLAHTESENKE